MALDHDRLRQLKREAETKAKEAERQQIEYRKRHEQEERDAAARTIASIVAGVPTILEEAARAGLSRRLIYSIRAGSEDYERREKAIFKGIERACPEEGYRTSTERGCTQYFRACKNLFVVVP